MSHAENYDELADRLTGEAPVKGKGKALYGDEAAAYGSRMIANAITPEQFAELPRHLSELPRHLSESLKGHMTEEQLEMLELLRDAPPSTLLFGGALSGKIIAPAEQFQNNNTK